MSPVANCVFRCQYSMQRVGTHDSDLKNISGEFATEVNNPYSRVPLVSKIASSGKSEGPVSKSKLSLNKSCV